jgi:hypothetical protein
LLTSAYTRLRQIRPSLGAILDNVRGGYPCEMRVVIRERIRRSFRWWHPVPVLSVVTALGLATAWDAWASSEREPPGEPIQIILGPPGPRIRTLWFPLDDAALGWRLLRERDVGADTYFGVPWAPELYEREGASANLEHTRRGEGTEDEESM